MNFQLNNLFTGILLYIPNILKALVLLLIAWAIATGVKKLLIKFLSKSRAREYLSKGRNPADPEYGKQKATDISQIAYIIVFLLFLPAILDALDMESVSLPISNMMQNLLAFIPRIFGAGIILFVGYFIAKIIRDLAFKFLQSVNVDKWYNKLMPSPTYTDPNKISNDKQYTLANVLSKIVFGIIMIPVITMALETLNIQTLTEPILLVLNNVMNMIPNIFVAIILILLGYYIAKFIGEILEQLLSKMGIEKVYSWMNENTEGNIPRFNLSKIIANLVKFLIILFMTVEALRVLKLDVLNTIGFSVISYLPLLISGLLIIGLGILGGYFVEGLINKYARSPFTAAIAKYMIIVLSVFMTLEQIKFASTIVNIAFLLVLGALSVAFALSFGLGGREFAKRQLEKFENKVELENNKPKLKDNPVEKMMNKNSQPPMNNDTDTTYKPDNNSPTPPAH